MIGDLISKKLFCADAKSAHQIMLCKRRTKTFSFHLCFSKNDDTYFVDKCCKKIREHEIHQYKRNWWMTKTVEILKNLKLEDISRSVGCRNWSRKLNWRGRSKGCSGISKVLSSLCSFSDEKLWTLSYRWCHSKQLQSFIRTDSKEFRVHTSKRLLQYVSRPSAHYYS